MKLKDNNTDEMIFCPKCKGQDFTDFIPVKTSTYHIWCKTEGCKTDLLISVKDVKEKIIEIQ
jgi:hypothetical protein